MTLSQAVLCIDKDYCKKVSISIEFGDGSRVFAFLDRKGSENYRR